MEAKSVSGRALCTFGLGGKLRNLYEPNSLEDLRKCLKLLEGRDRFYLGAGSNVLIAEEGLDTPVLKLGKQFSGYVLTTERNQIRDAADLAQLERLTGLLASSTASLEINLEQGSHSGKQDEAQVYCYVLAAQSLMSLSRELSRRGFSGLEFAAGIPASVGGALRMNAGAHGHSVSEVCQRVFYFKDSVFHVAEAAELNFSYRHCGLGEEALLLGAELLLKPEDAERVQQERARCLAYRRETQPLSSPSAGSVFKNPSPDELANSSLNTLNRTVAAAEILDWLGFKGLRRGGVEFSKQHANWLVNVAKSSSASDALELIKLAQEKVFEEYGLRLKPEILFWRDR